MPAPAVTALPGTQPGRRRRTLVRRGAGLSAVIAAAVVLGACGQDNLARCVDAGSSALVDVSRCDAEAADGTGGRYVWVFDGSGDTELGSRVSGGERVDPADQAAISQRGGFAPDAQTSGTGVRELGESAEAEGKKKKKKSFGSSRRR